MNATATPDIYTLSLHDALPISDLALLEAPETGPFLDALGERSSSCFLLLQSRRSEEHTSELQSLRHLVCRLLLEKKNSTKWQTLLVAWCARTQREQGLVRDKPP